MGVDRMKKYIKPEIVIENLFADTNIAASVLPFQGQTADKETEIFISGDSYGIWFGQ